MSCNARQIYRGACCGRALFGENKFGLLNPMIMQWPVAPLLIGAVLAVMPVQTQAAPLRLVASPNGDGVQCSNAQPCSIKAAQSRIREASPASEDVIVDLRAGTYQLDQTWLLDSSRGDSPAGPSRIVWQAQGYGGPHPASVKISGGRPVVGPWVPAGRLADGHAIYRAVVPATLETRQFYVNGRRADRATSTNIPDDLKRTATGYVSSDEKFGRYLNPGDVEFVYTGGDYGTYERSAPQPFTEAICGVDNVHHTNAVTTIELDRTCNAITSTFGAARWWADGAYQNLGRPTRVENAFELLGLPGQWYLDRTGAVARDGRRAIYYIPRDGEDMAHADFVAPQLETLVEGRGTVEHPLRNLTFRGITFAYATWNAPSTQGVIVEQANLLILEHAGSGVTTRTGHVAPNLHFSHADGLIFERDRFEHLGGDALVLDEGARGNRIEGSTFTDISGAGVRLGDYLHPEAAPGWRERDNVIANNVLHDLPVDYRSGSAIFTGFSERTTIAHNLVYNTPYTAISASYGFGMPNYQSGLRVVGNHVFDYMQILRDGGGIYTNGRQGPSYEEGALIVGNWIHDAANPYNAIYNDESARFVTISDNVLHNNVYDWGSCRPLGNMKFVGNFWQTGRDHLGCRRFFPEPNVIAENSLIANGADDCLGIARCAAIMNGAGLEAPFYDAAGRGWSGKSEPIAAPNWRWTGHWTKGNADTLGSTAMFAFTGTAVKLYFASTPGVAAVSLCDNKGDQCEPETMVDLSLPQAIDNAWPQYTRRSLDLADHVLRVRVAKGPLTLRSADSIIEPEQVDDGGDGRIRFAYQGPWVSRNDPTNDGVHDGTYGASSHASDATDATATLRFKGTGVRLYGVRDPRHGIARVTLDGSAPFDIDFFGFERRGDQALWESGVLDKGMHTLTIARTGRHNALARGSFIAIDRAEVFQ